LTINPLVANDKVAIAIVDEMLEAHKAYLPRFF
jgi:6-phospho-beta-glucosidase